MRVRSLDTGEAGDSFPSEVATRAVLLIAAMSAIAAGIRPCRPIGSNIADRSYTAGFAALVAYCGTTASLPALACAALVLAVFGGSITLHALGLLMLACLAVLARRRKLDAVAGAVIAAVTVQGLLRLPISSPTYGSAAAAAAGTMPILASAALGSDGAGRRIVVRALLAALGVVFVCSAIAGIVALRTHSLLDEAERNARAGVDAAKAADRQGAATDFARAEQNFRTAAHVAGAWWTWPARQVPVFAPQVRTIDQVVAIGAHTLPLAEAGVQDVDPNRLRLRNGRVDLAALQAYLPVFQRLATGTARASTELGRVRSTWLVSPLADAVARLARTVSKADDSAQTARQAVALAPQILGRGATRRYLVLFVTPAELRGSGGLIANYGVLVARDGALHLDALGRGPQLNDTGSPNKHLDGPAEYLARYGRFDPASTWENITMSPDFPSVGQVASQLYPQSGGTRVDGVLSLDPVALSDLLALTGPVVIPGLPHRLDAGNVVQFLYHDEYALNLSHDERINLLGAVARATFDQLTHGSSASPSEFANEMSPALGAKDLTMWFANAAEQQFAVRIGGDGSVAPATGDSFGLIAQNAGGNKLDAYLHRQVVYSATVDANSGRESASATITLRNDAPSSGLPIDIIGNQVGLPTGTTRLIIAAYSRLTLGTATLDGHPLRLVAEREFGRNVYWAYVDVPPGGSRHLVLHLDGAVDLSRGSYTFDWFSQVLPNPDRVDWSLHVEGGGRATGATSSPTVTIGRIRGDVHALWDRAPVAWHLMVALNRKA
ncbi:MAG TPA: DUF4012 domain-containing protein [Acidimicrobiia bacterium]